MSNSSTSTKRAANIKSFTSINDLRELEYRDVDLTHHQRLALTNFDRFRIAELNMQKTEQQFHNKYMQLQVMANLSSFEEFLKEEYFL